MKKGIWITIGVVVVAGTIVGLVLASRNNGQSGSIQGISWEWNSMKESAPAAQSVVPNPENYTITFNNDGTFTGQADCNRFSGTYEASKGQIVLQMGPTTLAECGPESLYGIFLSKLESVDGYSLQGNRLTLTFGGGAGEMRFETQ